MSKPKGNGSTGRHATPTGAAETGEASVGNAARDKDIRRRAYEIYLERGERTRTALVSRSFFISHYELGHGQ